MKNKFWILAGMILFVAIHRTAAQVPFTLSSSPSIGSFVRSVTAADVNGDGKPDLISVRGSASTLVVFTNGGNAVFGSNATYAVGSFPYQVIAADVNNDGWLNLLTANNSGNSLTVLTNDGNGGFAIMATLSAGASSAPQSVAAADLNGDGRLDLVSANSQKGTVTIWTNGGGIFVSNVSYTVGTNPRSATAADINGDGHADIICGSTGSAINALVIMTNNGSGGFAYAPTPLNNFSGVS